MKSLKPYRGFAIKQAHYRGHLFFFARKDGKEIARAPYKYELHQKLDRLCERVTA